MQHYFNSQILLLGFILSVGIGHFIMDEFFFSPEVNIRCSDFNPPEICEHDSIPLDTVIYNIDDLIIKMPVFFTPDGDGENDFYFPIVNDKKISITSFSIFTPEAMKKARVMYGSRIIKYGDKLSAYAWNGENRYRNEKYEREYSGTFRYAFTASTENSVIKCKGWACAIRP